MLRRIGAGEMGVNGVHIHPCEHLRAEAAPVEAEAVHAGIHHDVAPPTLTVRTPQRDLFGADENGVRFDGKCGGKIGSVDTVQHLHAQVRRVPSKRRGLLPVGDVDRPAAFGVKSFRHDRRAEAVAVRLDSCACLDACEGAELPPVGGQRVEVDTKAKGGRRDHARGRIAGPRRMRKCLLGWLLFPFRELLRSGGEGVVFRFGDRYVLILFLILGGEWRG